MKRVVFNLTDEQDARLERIARNMGVSKPEALRYALELYRTIKETQDEEAEPASQEGGTSRSVVEILG